MQLCIIKFNHIILGNFESGSQSADKDSLLFCQRCDSLHSQSYITFMVGARVFVSTGTMSVSYNEQAG